MLHHWRHCRSLQAFSHVYRAAPGLLERPGWSDEDGNPVALERPPSEGRHLGWRLAVSTSTASDGWQYASVFKCASLLPAIPLRRASAAVVGQPVHG